MEEKARHILVVDDDEYLLEIVRANLEAEGFIVTTAGDGRTALAMFKECHPDLVLLDIRMPESNGYDVLDSIRHESQVPVIMLTAVPEPEAVALTLGMGANDYIRKPFQPRELVARIRAKLRRANT